MPVRFSRLRLAGFKSFAEPVEVEILPGLTGIVGPNGCGKSNIVDALRFIMGEASSRQMRGTETEDLIFGGTNVRASRNVAEVTLTLEAEEHELFAPLEKGGTFALSRQIERGRGSVFRINGHEARARDVQVLFANLGSGSHSSALIGQGRIAELIAQRPEARRTILEEAAGIVGLHGRRHEAELKLAATEANLVRAQELKTEIEQQLTALKRQARQANRYRNLGSAIETVERELLAIAKARAQAALAEREAALTAARTAAADTTAQALRTAKVAAEGEAALPLLRSAEQTERTELERVRLAREQLTAEEARNEKELTEMTARLAALDRDLTHTDAVAADARAAEQRLAEESAALAHSRDGLPGRIARAMEAFAAARSARETADAAAEREAGVRATLVAQTSALAREQERAEGRGARLAAERRQIEAEHSRAAATSSFEEKYAAAQATEATATSELVAARENRERLEAARLGAVGAHEAARERFSIAEAERVRLTAEVAALKAALVSSEPRSGPALADALRVPPGLESALAAALGEAAYGSETAWRALPALADPASLPEQTTALAELISGPAVLARVLPAVGVVTDTAQAAALQEQLAPGQALVSREGGLWRWDGYMVPSGRASAVGARLRQRNRLAELAERIGAVEGAALAARGNRDVSAKREQEITKEASAAEAARRAAEHRYEDLRRTTLALQRDATAANARIAALGERLARITADAAEADTALAQLVAQRANLADPKAAERALAVARETLAEARTRESATRTELTALEQKSSVLAAREAMIARERKEWVARSEGANEHRGELLRRRASLGAQNEQLAARPQALAVERAHVVAALDATESAYQESARVLIEAEETSALAARALKVAEQQAARAREATIKCEALFEQASGALADVTQRIREQFGGDPALPDVAFDAPAEEAARARLARLLRERENLGAVNLRAEIEAAELEARARTLEHEGDELAAAIAKLRASIGRLNHAGRERLVQVFTEVDRHFQALFTRMFGGGRAHLGMVGSDDPLVAGLELYAQPPGKKLTALGLLSGGEQALLALSLVFAVFRCNPGPIAVLDEVDAPFDDANVGRFAELLVDVARSSATRMLVVTHHPLTMARMDRLYGVTMQERGVSRLLSVDLARGAELAEERSAAMP